MYLKQPLQHETVIFCMQNVRKPIIMNNIQSVLNAKKYFNNFLYCIDDIRNDVCHTNKKIQSGIIVMRWKSIFLVAEYKDPNHVMDIVQWYLRYKNVDSTRSNCFNMKL